MICIKSYDQLILSSFSRIRNGFFFDENYQPYTKEFLEKMTHYFLTKEDYESCQILKNFIDIRFDHENGYKNII